MALSANTVWEVRDDGDDANGGGFVTGATGTDRSQQASPHVTIDGATITATVHTTTTQLTLVGHTVATADVGNIVSIAGGTMTAGYYHITAVDTVNNRWTIDRSGGTAGQTGTGRMGGALNSIGRLGSAVNAGVANVKAFIREGTYTLTSSTANVSGGTYDNTSNINCQIIGYSASGGRTDLSAGPTIDVGVITTVTVFDINNGSSAGVAVVNVIVDGQGNSTITAYDLSFAAAAALLCQAIDCTTGFICQTTARALACKATGCTTGFSLNQLAWRCWADNCTTGFTASTNSTPVMVDCVASDCGSAFANGASHTGLLWLNCSGDGSTSNDGINGNALGCAAIACLMTNNSLYGIDLNGSNTFAYLNATYGNTSGGIKEAASGQTRNFSAIALSSDPYVASGSDDFRPNNTAGGGALLRAAGMSVPGQTDNRDIGAVQHTDFSVRSRLVLGI